MNFGRELAAVRIFEEILPKFTFLFGEPRTPGELPELIGRGCLACVPFTAPTAGCLAFAVPEALALEIAANTLGVDPAHPDAAGRAQDAVKEVASVMGGHLASAMETPDVSVALFPPQFFSLERGDWDRLRNDPATRCFAVDQHPVLLRVGPEMGGSR